MSKPNPGVALARRGTIGEVATTIQSPAVSKVGLPGSALADSTGRFFRSLILATPASYALAVQQDAGIDGDEMVIVWDAPGATFQVSILDSVANTLAIGAAGAAGSVRLVRDTSGVSGWMVKEYGNAS